MQEETSSPQTASDSTHDASMSLWDANIIGTVAGVGAALLVLLPHLLLWGSLTFDGRHLLNPLVIFPAFVVSIIVHEALHGLGWKLAGKKPWSSMKFGLQSLTPYAHCKEAMHASAYRVGVVFPLLWLGLLPALVGTLTGYGALTIWGSIMVLVAGGDLAILWILRRVPGTTLVRDHPTRAGCEIVAG